jgi:hypothetical protein
MPPKKQQTQGSSSSKVKVDKVSQIFYPSPLFPALTKRVDLRLEERAFHPLAYGFLNHRGLTLAFLFKLKF